MFDEKQYFHALTFSHPKLSSLKAVHQNILGDDFVKEKEIQLSSDFRVWHFNYKTVEPIQRIPDDLTGLNIKVPRSETMNGKTYYLYDCYLLKIKIDNKPVCFIFAAPFKKILKSSIDSSAPKLQSEKLSFYLINLIQFCKKIESAQFDHILNITRINLYSIVEPALLKSVAMYGDNILSSGPYGKIKEFTSPSALRISYFGHADDKFSFNTDRGGNWSFYLRVKEELFCFKEIYGFLFEQDLLETSFNDPRRRESSQNIEQMD